MPRNALLDFAQSASNAVAQNVSGPVDLIGAGLRAVGVPVPQNALGSSQWMADKGLTKDVPMGAARIAGETFGMAAPTAVAANAAQIAAWHRKVDAVMAQGAKAVGQTAADKAGNYMAQSGLIQPATVWHGSPHKFDKLDSSKIGTGEGAQAYGHGLYLAESPDVARGYRDKLTPGAGWGYDNVPANLLDKTTRSAATQLSMEMRGVGTQNGWPDVATAKQMAARKLLKQGDEAAATMVAKLDPAKIAEIEGSLYKVDLPDEQIAKMLDWDKPLSQQASAVRDAINRVARQPGPLALDRVRDDMRGNDWATLVKTPAGSEALRRAGIPGIRYLDGGSRGAGQGTSNYVVFPGGENMLKILARNGQELP